LASNWQSAVAKIASRPKGSLGSTDLATRLATPQLNPNDPMIMAAAGVADDIVNSASPAASAGSIDIRSEAADHVKQCATAAFTVAKARVEGRTVPEATRGQLEDFGTCDPRWIECVTEFVAHYTLTKHADVPYRRWKSMDDFVISLPERCKVAVIGDWGTGTERAAKLLAKVAALQPDILLHLGDIYYSCTGFEADNFFVNARKPFPPSLRIFTLCGNHDLYSGGAGYYALLSRLGQPASFFCLRNAYWQLLAMDTGYNDFDPLHVDDSATWVQDFDDRTDPYSELAWHRDKLQTAGTRRTVLLSHHQPFTFNAPIAKNLAINRRLLGQFSEWLPQVALWLWGHEHNQLIYAPFSDPTTGRSVTKGRCIGASAIPVVASDTPYTVADEIRSGPDKTLPTLLDDKLKLAVDTAEGLYDLGFAMLTFNQAQANATYYQYDSTQDVATAMYSESL
jgi:hypothetical protein